MVGGLSLLICTQHIVSEIFNELEKLLAGAIDTGFWVGRIEGDSTVETLTRQHAV